MPDLFVGRGLGALPDTSYRVWEVDRAPDCVLEVASPANEERDSPEKQAEYASMGVREYWRFNPIGSLVGAGRAGERLEGASCRGGRAGRSRGK